jgi:hypothetical protein
MQARISLAGVDFSKGAETIVSNATAEREDLLVPLEISSVITQLYIIHLTKIKQDIKNPLPVISFRPHSLSNYI